jgi:ribosomal protein L12E/L44/L45/RPP1/RPP2
MPPAKASSAPKAADKAAVPKAAAKPPASSSEDEDDDEEEEDEKPVAPSQALRLYASYGADRFVALVNGESTVASALQAILNVSAASRGEPASSKGLQLFKEALSGGAWCLFRLNPVTCVKHVLSQDDNVHVRADAHEAAAPKSKAAAAANPATSAKPEGESKQLRLKKEEQAWFDEQISANDCALAHGSTQAQRAELAQRLAAAFPRWQGVADAKRMTKSIDAFRKRKIAAAAAEAKAPPAAAAAAAEEEEDESEEEDEESEEEAGGGPPGFSGKRKEEEKPAPSAKKSKSKA